ncbi:DinB family protein [Planococcus sp. YIM B11945]|uniref:DinB family protein n=1 Tax=Planococcus sp. YIM B11945 TaxID=3435410 RepID=UPI003D7EC53E
MIDYRVAPLEGFTEKIGELVFMLEHVRSVTVQEVSKLSRNALDTAGEAGGNSIGALLSHMAAIEKAHQLISFKKRNFTPLEYAEWRTVLELGEEAKTVIQGNDLDFYVEQLREVRTATLNQFRKFDDSWLYEESAWPNGTPYNHYYLWFHVLEDEINHRGQIRTIMRQIKNGGFQ